jgi:hypothetical protein
MSRLNTVRVSIQSKNDVRVTVQVNRERERTPLRFGIGNAKLARLDPAIWTFSLPAGHSCPQSRECRSRADRKSGWMTDGVHTRFRCYAATMEARHPSVRRSRWSNYDALRACRSREEMTRLMLDSLSPFCRVLRVHDSGDFFSLDYLRAWLEVARQRRDTIFYWYSKSLSYWATCKDDLGDGHSPGRIKNVVPTASWGGAEDELIGACGFRSARVVFSQAEAEALNLPIDHDDSHAMTHGPDFALLLHGTQPRDSEAAQAVRALRDSGFHGYGERNRVPLRVV